ncbi:MAG: serpin family protein [Bacteroidales bacterium]|nr:serpin family protein [Bacteroidales bacterium]
MKKLQFLVLLSGLMFFAGSCKKEKEPEKKINLSNDEMLMVGSSNTFGFDLFRYIEQNNESQENIMVSPLSIDYALFMAYNGAKGETKEQMKSVLHTTGLSDEQFNQNNLNIMNALMNVDPLVQMKIANSIWHDKDFNVLSRFIQVNQTFYKAIVESLDFSDPQSVQIINNWVSEQTNGKIPAIIDAIPDDAVLYLINAIYFKGQWKYQFDETLTMPRTFYKQDGTQSNPETMVSQAAFRYYENEKFEAVELPYGQGNYSMVVLLPKTSSNPSEVISLMNSQNWDSWIEGMVEQESVVVYLPRFTFSYEMLLNSTLQGLGMTNAFNPEIADFSGITTQMEIFISRVIHKTIVEVNEQGTEAAAVTAIEFYNTSTGPDEPEPKYFYVDRPFVFVIRERDTNAVLFAGKVMEP